MTPQELTEDLLAILKIIKEKGGTDCSGSCHHRKPGEFHCHVFAPMLKISSQGVKNRILMLMREGFLERKRVEREGTYPITRFVITSAGEDALTLHGYEC
jgi:hypothetical protein